MHLKCTYNWGLWVHYASSSTFSQAAGECSLQVVRSLVFQYLHSNMILLWKILRCAVVHMKKKKTNWIVIPLYTIQKALILQLCQSDQLRWESIYMTIPWLFQHVGWRARGILRNGILRLIIFKFDGNISIRCLFFNIFCAENI